MGSSTNPWLVKAFYEAAQKVEEVEPYYYDTDELFREKNKKSIVARAENKYGIGCGINRINREMISRAIEEKVDFVFLYAARTICVNSVISLKQMGIRVLLYCNDDPYAPYYPRYFWRHFKRSIQHADIVYVYRASNIEESYRSGAKTVKLLKPYYIKERNFHIDENEAEIPFVNRSIPKVCFLGHFEKDERGDYIKALTQEGVTVGVPERKEWQIFANECPGIVLLKNTRKEYNETMNQTQIALVFLSKINRDTYTRRCLEIPATKTMMLAPYTKELASMYEEGKEVVFYRGIDDFVEKTKYYLDHSGERISIANAGYERLMRNKDEAEDRIREILADCRCITRNDR